MRSVLAGLRRLVIPWGARTGPRIVLATGLTAPLSDAAILFYVDETRAYLIDVDLSGGVLGEFGLSLVNLQSMTPLDVLRVSAGGGTGTQMTLTIGEDVMQTVLRALGSAGITVNPADIAIVGPVAVDNIDVSGALTGDGIGVTRAAFRSTDSAARANTIAPADDDQLTFPDLPANSVWALDGWLRWSCTSPTPGLRSDFTGPLGADMVRSFFAQPTSGTTTIGPIDTGSAGSIGADDTRQTINGVAAGDLRATLTMGASRVM
ncbi:hypothetical protein [Phytohabitans rumicis]|uniref:Uncharacterized protein n=1 Tax=Phytohabitans rumicis TaxID=1076125 RepID=A0A6V8LBV0_9ACTN|nr:hypothetical protein [Phytohabitans rumicis]GFJ92488.1 hypothetical protein Prum_061300 [Phytohabitans rumicis]